MRYLAGTRAFGLISMKNEPEGIQAQGKATRISASAAADWANDKGDRRSVTGGILRYNGNPVGLDVEETDGSSLVHRGSRIQGNH